MHSNLPLAMMANLVQSASHSSIECEVKMSDAPSCTSLNKRVSVRDLLLVLSQHRYLLSTFHICRFAKASIPLVGSSIRMRCGWPRSETAAHT